MLFFKVNRFHGKEQIESKPPLIGSEDAESRLPLSHRRHKRSGLSVAGTLSNMEDLITWAKSTSHNYPTDKGSSDPGSSG